MLIDSVSECLIRGSILLPMYFKATTRSVLSLSLVGLVTGEEISEFQHLLMTDSVLHLSLQECF